MIIPTGIGAFDEFLGGGLESNAITTIYGDAGSGKTCISLLCAINVVKNQKKVIYIDAEDNFSSERLQQLSSEHVLENILLLRPKSFKEQKASIEKLQNLLNEKIGLVILDSIVKLYRLAMTKTLDSHPISKELGSQLKALANLAQQKSIPIIVTSHSYRDFKTGQINVVGGEWVKDVSKTLIELQNIQNGTKRAVLKKHTALSEKIMYFKIKEKGIIAQTGFNNP